MNKSTKPLAATLLVAGILLGSTAGLATATSSSASTRQGGADVDSAVTTAATPVFDRPRPCYRHRCAV